MTKSQEEQIKILEERVKALESKMGGAPKSKKPRKPSAFNNFMKETIPKVKEENPTISHSEAFKKAASMWKDQKTN